MHVPRLFTAAILTMALILAAPAQTMQTTTVSGTVYAASGAPVSGTLQISWPAFTTAAGEAIAAGRTTVNIPSSGQVSVALAPNTGATPAGLYYTAVYHLADGSTSTEYWVVPNNYQAALGSVRASVMPAAQAVQAVSKTYVDQSIQQAIQSQITPSGGTLTGPLYLARDPVSPLEAADKHYVDASAANSLPLAGGTLSGPVKAPQIGAVLQADQFRGSDFGARLQACVNALNPAYGGTCDARNFGGQVSMAANLTISTPNATVLLPCSTIATAASIVVPAGTRNVTLHGCASRGTSAASGAQGGTVLLYSGSSSLLQIGDPSFVADTKGFRLDNAALNTTAATAGSAQAMAFDRTQEISLASVYLLGNANQTALTLDGTGNYTGGTFQDMQFTGYQTAVNGIGHTVENAATTDWLNASTFLRVHIDCPTQNGNPVAGTTGINLQAGDGNTFTGGDVESCGTALHLGAHAVNNTLVGIRNENNGTQIQADAGSSYNNWITGGTMFTGKLVDNGTRNSFLDTFHRSFNALNGDWYGSQQDATVTNHWRLGIGTGNERGLLSRYQTDYGYRWTTGLSDATAGEQYYQVLDELNNVYRLSIGQYNNGQSSTNNQTVLNAAGTGAVILNGSNNAGTGGVVFGSGGPASATVATVDKAGNAHFTGTLLTDQTAQSTGTMTVRNNADSEVDYYLWPGATTSQKGSFTYKDFNGASQWYMLKDQNNNWALNSAVGGIDSFKAYQSTNSGDTYVNAANPTGHIRLNYEAGSGAETDIYSGSSSALAAAFLNPTAIKFPGLASSIGKNCLQIDNSGYISNTATPCATGGSGTVGSGSAGQIAYYTADGTSLAGTSTVPLASGGTGAATAVDALKNLGALGIGGGTLSGALTATQFNGPVKGDVTGNLTGNVTGNVTGNISGTAANVTGTVALGNGGTGATTAAGALTNIGALGLAGGTLTGPLTATQFNGPVKGDVTGNLTGNVTGNVSGTAANVTGTVAIANGGTGATTAPQALTNLGALPIAGGTLTGPITATQFNGPLTGNVTGNLSGTAANVTGTVAIANGGTGATTAPQALTNLGALPISGGTLTGSLTATQFNGPLTGNVTGNVSGTAANVTGTVAVANGGTGATSASAALTSLGAFPAAGGTLTGTITLKNNTNAEADYILQPGSTASQKGAFTWKDYNGTSEWYLIKDTSNNLAINSAIGALDSFKAYQSSNSGDTYLDAANSTGHIRLNYETGSGAETDIYSGSSTSLDAAFLGPTSIKFPGLAASTGHNCLQIDTSGYIANTAAPCATGTVSSGTTGQIAYYSATGTSVSGLTSVPVTAGGTGATTAAQALTNLGALPLTGGTLTGALSATQFNGPLSGNVTGNVAGNLTGNVTGNLNGSVTGNVVGNVTGSITFPDNSVQTTSQQGALTGAANDSSARTAAASAQTAATAAQASASTAETDAQTGITNAAKAGSDARAALSAAASAQTAASTSEADAQTGITNAAKAETDAQSGLTNAAAAQTVAAAAQAGAATAETDAQTGISSAAKAETDAQAAITAAATAQTAANAAAAAAAAAQAHNDDEDSEISAAQTAANSALNGQANDATARAAASAAQTTGSNALNGRANDSTARSAADAAETDAQAAISNAAKADTDAQTGIANAATAQAAADAAQTAAASAQTDATNALSGQANDATARAAANSAQTAAATAETDAQTGIANAAAAQAAANQAEADAQSAITTANAAFGTTTATSTGSGTANVVAFPGTVAANSLSAPLIGGIVWIKPAAGQDIGDTFAAGVNSLPLDVHNQPTGIIALDPSQNWSASAWRKSFIKPANVLLDCNGASLIWTGWMTAADIAAAGSSYTAPPVSSYSNPAAARANTYAWPGITPIVAAYPQTAIDGSKGGVRNCNIQEAYSSSNVNSAIYSGGDPAGLIAPSAYYGSYQVFANNNISGFHSAWAWGNNTWSVLHLMSRYVRNYDGIVTPVLNTTSNSGENIEFSFTTISNNYNLGFDFGASGDPTQTLTFTHGWCDYNAAGCQNGIGYLRFAYSHAEQWTGPLFTVNDNGAVEIEDSQLVTGAPEWKSSATYTLGQWVLNTADGNFYSSLQNNNTANAPQGNPSWWQLQSAQPGHEAYVQLTGSTTSMNPTADISHTKMNANHQMKDVVYSSNLASVQMCYQGVRAYAAAGDTVPLPFESGGTNSIVNCPTGSLQFQAGIVPFSAKTGGSASAVFYNSALGVNGRVGILIGNDPGTANADTDGFEYYRQGTTSTTGVFCRGFANDFASGNMNCSDTAGNFGIGSETPSTAPISWDKYGAAHQNGASPTASSGTLTGANAGGYVSGLSAATTVTITFANSGWNAWASCTAATSANAQQPYVSSISKSAVTFTFPSLTGTLYYQCTGK